MKKKKKKKMKENVRECKKTKKMIERQKQHKIKIEKAGKKVRSQNRDKHNGQ
jgi:hypothetical protein